MTVHQLELQLKALQRLLKEGEVKNVYSVQGKIDKLRKDIRDAKEVERINKWLGQ